jgi:methionyl-tRNA synthetase
MIVMSDKRRILVTSALPYANGSIHLGHLVEYIQTDVWARFQKMRGHECVYICADDTHGTPIMLSAQKQGITPEELIEKVHVEHQADFAAFHVEFDTYHTTHCDENKELSELIYNRAKAAGAICEKDIEQLYDEEAGMFLPDRFVKGECPKCEAKEQYGDSCEVCSATYSPKDLVEPVSVVSGQKPVLRHSNHIFFKLSDYEGFLQEWFKQDPVHEGLKKKLNEWFESGLKDWDISRDAPYFGFKIPGTDDKYFYVWVDAPVGYMASTKKWCETNGGDFDSIWVNGDYEIHHFIGKDILYFHTLFWPVMLHVAEFQTPHHVHVHGFLTVNGEKMSKSRGTFILASSYLEQGLNPEYLRYYYASKLSASVEDIDLNFDDFIQRVNSDVVNKFVNIGSRLGAIVRKKLDLKLSTPDAEGETLLAEMRQSIPVVADLYDARETNKAMREIMRLADLANQYIDQKAPWTVVKTDEEHARAICTSGLNALAILSGLLSPVMPVLSSKVASFLGITDTSWDAIGTLISDREIAPFERMADRVDADQVASLTCTPKTA